MEKTNLETIGKLSINEWAVEDRPREKMEQRGPEALTVAELLAILIGSGSTDESAVDLMRRLVMDCDGSLNTLGRMSIKELTSGKYKGVGKAKAITILAACELGKRRMMEATPVRTKVTTDEDLYNAFRPFLMDLSHEECHILLLNVKQEILGHEIVSMGGLTEASVDVRLVLRHALLYQATAVALAHNHPSGNCHPSLADDDMTRRLREACRTVGIKLVDHLVIADGKDNFYSYYANSKL